MPAPQPHVLPIEPAPARWRWARILLVGAAQAVALLAFAAIADSVHLHPPEVAIPVVALLALINGFVWPLVVRFTLPLILLTVGLFTFVLNAVVIEVVAAMVDGFEAGPLWVAFLLAVVLAAVNMFVGGLMHVDDDHVWRQHVVRRMVARREPPEPTDVPGFLFIQIDGLGHDVLRDAIADGQVPMLASLLDAGTHEMLRWECDLSSQTGAMQAGILLGDNANMPAFRWYEKDTGRVMVSNRPRDAADLEARQSSGSGLLIDGGASRGNVFSGDAPDTMFTFSTVLNQPLRRDRFVYVISTPFAMIRIVLLMITDVIRELRAARRARRDDVTPRMHRGGVYPLLRAATTVVLAEVTYSMLIGDIERGAPSAYVDLVGYDEVAHHSGIAAPEALDVLHRTDDQLRRLLTTLVHAPRPYFVVFLSDHGQTQGATFEQRYGETLHDFVISQVDRRDVDVAAPELAPEGWNNVNGLLSDAVADDSRLGRFIARSARGHTVDGEVKLGPDTDVTVADDSDLVVLASGNLGLISFTTLEGRASRQSIEAAYPGLIDALAAHPGVGLVLVRDEDLGDVVLGADGVRHLIDDSVTGTDPLEPFGANAADHLRRTSGFTNCPDLLVNSFYDPVSNEGAAFEELIGFHGGLGGAQCHPFIFAPAGLAAPSGPLVGAESIHHLFKSWINTAQHSE